jgi:FkbM family methyltransferase
MQTLKEISYNPRLLAIARGLHFTNMLRKCYLWVTGRKHKILTVNLGRFAVLFHVHSDVEYRNIEHSFVTYERDFLDALLSSLAEGDVFLDVGSSLGQFTVPMAKVVGKSGLVLAVEPEAGACAQLEANLRLNGSSNVLILRIALGDECREGRLSWKDGSCPSLVNVPPRDQETALTTAPSAACGMGVVSVEVGDTVMDRERLPIPKAVKIDVEGYEFQVIRGLSRTLRNASCRLLCCEIHPDFLPSGTTSQQIVTEVKSLGFTDTLLMKRGGQVHMIARKDQSQA